MGKNKPQNKGKKDPKETKDSSSTVPKGGGSKVKVRHICINIQNYN